MIQDLLYIAPDKNMTGEETFRLFARNEHDGREFQRTEDGGYQFVDGIKVYRLTIVRRNGWYVSAVIEQR